VAEAKGHRRWLHCLVDHGEQLGGEGVKVDLADIVRRYGLRNWVEQGYKQVKGELGWADFQVRSDRAIRRHWALVCCAFSFCWQAFLAGQPPAPQSQAAPAAARGAQATGHPGGTGRAAVVASGAVPGVGPG
jgi:hypothetical protein